MDIPPDGTSPALRRYRAATSADRVAPGDVPEDLPTYADPDCATAVGIARQVGEIAAPVGHEALWMVVTTEEGPVPGRFVLRQGEFVPVGLAGRRPVAILPSVPTV
jgi:hypothetical protein